MADLSFWTASTVPVCEDEAAGWKNLLVVSPNAAFDPVAWYHQDGLNSPGANSYIKGQLLTGVSVPMALMGVVLLFGVLFVAWRLLRSCNCCGNDHMHISPLAELRDPWLHAHQALVVAAGVCAIALAVYGMVTLPKDPFSDVATQADGALDYASGVVDQVDVTLDAVRAINDSMAGVQYILDVDVNAPAILAQLTEMEPFVYGVQDSGPMKSALQSLYGQLTGQLQPLLTTLLALLSTVTTELLPAITQASSLQLQVNNTKIALGWYQDKLATLPPEFSSSTMEAIIGLKTAQDALDAREREINASMAALTQIESARTSNLLPGIVKGCEDLSNLQQAMAPAAATLTSGMVALRDLNPGSLADVLPSLEARLRHINSTVIVLDDSTLDSYSLIQLASSTIVKLYPNATASNSATVNASLDAWVDRLKQLEIRLASKTLVDALANALEVPSDRLANALDVTPLRDVLKDIASNLRLASLFVEPVRQALQAHMQSNTAETYSVLLSRASIVVSAEGAVRDAIDSLSNSDNLAHLRTIEYLGMSVEGGQADKRASEAQASALDVQREVSSYSDKQVAQLTDILDAVDEVVQRLPVSRSQVFAGPRHLLVTTVNQARDGMAGVSRQVQDAVGKIAYHSEDLRTEILPSVKSREQDTLDVMNETWSYMFKGLMAGYSIVIFFMLLISLVALVKFPFGVVLTSVLLLLGVFVWLAVGLAVMGAMVVLQDACESAERILVTELSSSPRGQSFGDFYLSRAPTPGGIKAVLRESAVIDVDKVLEDMTDSQNALLDSLQTSWRLQPPLSGALMDITAAVEAAQAQVNSVVSLVEFGPVHGMYVGIKTEACCGLGAQLMVIWICVTGSGLFAWLAVVFSKFVLGRLDLLPKDNCLGCQCYRTADYEAPSSRVKRRFWSSWGGGSSAGGSTAMASIGGASSIASQELKPPNGPLAVRIVRDCGAGGSCSGAGSSSGGGGSSALYVAGGRRSRTGAGAGQSGAWWRLAYAQPAVAEEEDAEANMQQGIQMSSVSVTTASHQPSPPPALLSVPSAPLMPAEDHPVSASDCTGDEVAPTYVQLFAWPTPPVRVSKMSASSPASQSAAPGAALAAQTTAATAVQPLPVPGQVQSPAQFNQPAAIDPPAAVTGPAAVTSPTRTARITVLDEATAEAMERQMRRSGN